MTPYSHLSLFSGIGGLDLAAEWAGFETIGQVEKDDYCLAVLKKHWPGVPKWRNVEDVTADALRDAGIAYRPTVLSGGFPCQPFSCAGKREGTADGRYLWPEMLRVVQELRPAWVVGENVAGIISLALDDMCADLERAGYACRAFVLPAAGAGAPHMRNRVFVVAHAAEESGRSPDPTSCTLGEDNGSRGDALRSGLRQPTGNPAAALPHAARELPHRAGETWGRRPKSPDSRLDPNPLRSGREERNAPSLSVTTRYVARRGDATDVLHADLDIRPSKREDRRVGRLEQPIPEWGEQCPPPYLNPAFVEWLMGFPTGWTDVEPSATP